MRAALISCGPSLASMLPLGLSLFDRIIAVNDAAAFVCADWWSVGDAKRFWSLRDSIKGRPAILMIDNDRDRVIDKDPRERCRTWMTWSALRRDHADAPQSWDSYSATAALVLAAELGATSITCFGCYFPGAMMHTFEVAERSETRWKAEWAIWSEIVAWLRDSRGCTVAHRENALAHA